MLLNTKALKRLINGRKNGVSSGGAGDSFILDSGSPILGGADNFDYSFTNRKLVFSIVVIALSIIIQEAAFNDLRVFANKPNIILASLVLISMSVEPAFAMFLGLFSGLAVDIAFGRYLGFYGLIYMYFCVVTAAVMRPRFKGRPIVYLSTAPLFFFVYTLVAGFGARFMSLYASKATVLYEDFGGHLLMRILPSSLYTYLVFIFLLLPVTLMLNKLGRFKRKGIGFKS
ncbi:MAG: hypothetical protein K6G89_05020 [Clostridia bacterium]|nr:hypothetical protein [Clostridia bacterium]